VAAESLAAQLRQKRSEMMISEVAGVALRLFEDRGFDVVTVEDIAATAHISVRTFYRYFPAKEDVLQVNIERRAAAVRAALAERPADEAPLQSLRLALAQVVAAEDPVLRRRWTSVVAATPGVLPGVLGGIQLKSLRSIAEFLGGRLDLPSESLVPTRLAAAGGGVIQAASTQWFIHGGDLAATIAEGIEVLERGIGSDPQTWSSRPKKPRSTGSPGRSKPANRRRPG
jgi:AcrR family transcriptional regulator